MFLVELQRRLGDEAFFSLLTTWVNDHKYGNGSTAQFLALAATYAHAPIDDLSQPWLFGTSLPALSF